MPFDAHAFDQSGLGIVGASREPLLAGLLSFHLGLVSAVVLALDLLDHLIDCLGLLFPFALAHLELLLEQLVVGLPVAATHAVPERRELAVIVVEVQMVHGMASGAVDDG